MSAPSPHQKRLDPVSLIAAGWSLFLALALLTSLLRPAPAWLPGLRSVLLLLCVLLAGLCIARALRPDVRRGVRRLTLFFASILLSASSVLLLSGLLAR